MKKSFITFPGTIARTDNSYTATCTVESELKLTVTGLTQAWKVQSSFGRSNSPVSNTRDRSNSFVGPGICPIHLMLKYTPGSNSDGSNSRTQSMVRRAIFHVKALWWLEPNISIHESRLIKVHYYFHKRSVTMMILPLGYLTDEWNVWNN